MIAPIDILKVNFLGTRLFTELVIKQMSEDGAIVNSSSDSGYAWRKNLPLTPEFLANDTFDGGLAWHEKNQEAAGHPYAFGKEALNVWTM